MGNILSGYENLGPRSIEVGENEVEDSIVQPLPNSVDSRIDDLEYNMECLNKSILMINNFKKELNKFYSIVDEQNQVQKETTNVSMENINALKEDMEGNMANLTDSVKSVNNVVSNLKIDVLRKSIDNDIQQTIQQTIQQEYSNLISQNLSDVRSQLRLELKSELLAEIKNELRSELKTELSAEIKNELRLELKTELYSELYDKLKLEIREEQKKDISKKIKTSLVTAVNTLQETNQELNDSILKQTQEVIDNTCYKTQCIIRTEVDNLTQDLSEQVKFLGSRIQIIETTQDTHGQYINKKLGKKRKSSKNMGFFSSNRNNIVGKSFNQNNDNYQKKKYPLESG